jgi:hypothetical protein
MWLLERGELGESGKALCEPYYLCHPSGKVHESLRAALPECRLRAPVPPVDTHVAARDDDVRK